MRLQERLKIAFDKERDRRLQAGEPPLTKTMLWKAAKVSPSACTHWFTGANDMNLDTCLKVAPLLNVSPLWLFDESRPMDDKSLIGHSQQNNDVTIADVIKLTYDVSKMQIPLITWAQATFLSDMKIQDCHHPEKWLSCPTMHSEKTYALRVISLAMFNPDPSAQHSFKNGEIIFVDPDKPPQNNSFVIVRLGNQPEVTFRQLIIDGGYKFLRPINPEWPEKIIPLTDKDVICGTVIYKGMEI